MELLAPHTESYAPPADFQFAATQREDEFAQLSAAGADPAEAMVAASLVTQSEATRLGRYKLTNMALRLLQTDRLYERVAYYRQLHEMSLSTTIERVQQELAAVAFADFANIYTEDGEPITNPHDLPRHLRAAVKEYKIDKDGVLTVKFHDKMKGLQMLGDLGGFFNEANAAKAPQVNISIGDAKQTQPRTIDVTPDPDPDPLA